MVSFITFKELLSREDIERIYTMASANFANIFPMIGKTRDHSVVEERLLKIMRENCNPDAIIGGCIKHLRQAIIHHIEEGRAIYKKYENPSSVNPVELNAKSHCLLDLLHGQAPNEAFPSVWYAEIDFNRPRALILRLKENLNDQTYTWKF